ncbi:hypothetical protein BS78_10G017600 [Paspalum vaginatum]|nr:hypothetical protein BS78_10G017600 [Paspalum vaginatum]
MDSGRSGTVTGRRRRLHACGCELAETGSRLLRTQGYDVPTVSEVRLSLEDARLEEDDQGPSGNPHAQGVAGDAQNVVDGDDNVEEIWSTPQVPYTGQTFVTQYEARAYYNDYKKELESDEHEEGAEHEEDNQDGLKKKKKVDGGKKRKREKTKYTKCKARMVVKLIGSRWQEREFITLLYGCNLTTGRIMQLMSEFYDSAQLVPYEAKDVGNFRSTIRRTEKYKDLQKTLDLFREIEREDPAFFYKIKLDDENRVEHIFWVDSAARHAYIEAYHDCISFDATYMTNIHGNTFQVGCVFLRDEKIPSYKWLFETFLEAMKGIAPLNIITDQDAATRSAISIVFPCATHRNCCWHIMDKFASTIGLDLDANKDLEEDFKECMNYTSFVPAYYMHCFFPFLQSTQRSERFNALLKKYVNPNLSNLSILHFFRQYQKIQEKCLVAQDAQDFRTDENERRRWSSHFVYGYGKRNYVVTAVEEEESYYYECIKFDRDGITCCHIMKIMTRLGVKAIPDRFVLKRWTQEAISNERAKKMKNVDEQNKKCKKGPVAPRPRTNEVPNSMDVPTSAPTNTTADPSTTADMHTSVNIAGIFNPPRSKMKGRKKEKRLVKGMNAKAKMKNHCSVCKSTSHNAARCPNKVQKGAERQELKLFA